MGASGISSVGFESVMALLLLSSSSVLILKSFGFRGAPLVGVIAALVAISSYASLLGEVSGIISELGAASGAGEYVRAALKVVGISYLSGISRDTVSELGESGIARCIGVITRLELLSVSAPFIKEMLSSLLSLMESA